MHRSIPGTASQRTENGRVVELDLSENELNGTIPSELGNLTYLETG